MAQNVEETGGGLSDLLEFFSVTDSDKNDLTVDNAVQLMTVHASKGLDFKIVILPCLHKAPNRQDLFVISQTGDISLKLRDQLGHDRRPTPNHSFIKEDEERAELAESKRVFYVASTRAKEELYYIGNFIGALENRIKGDVANAIKSSRWLDWMAQIFSKDIEEAVFAEGENKIQTKILRELIMLNDPARLFEPIPEMIRRKQVNAIRRYSVSMIRDFAISPQTMLDNIIKSDNGKLATPTNAHGADVWGPDASGTSTALVADTENAEQVGSIIHSMLENYSDEEALKNILKVLPPKTMDRVVKIVKGFMDSEVGKKVFDATEYISEHGFLAKISGDVVTGRIDRINIYKDRIWVIDYKTGVDEKMLEGYKAQMACYLYYAQQAYPGLPVTGSIIDVTKGRDITYGPDELTGWIEKVIKEMGEYLG
jgi:ATP-dependent exoDNAse (exonuclease V) beta subunit